MSDMRVEELEMVLVEMKKTAKEHPKANVIYDTDKHRIVIYYPLPSNYIEINKNAGLDLY